MACWQLHPSCGCPPSSCAATHSMRRPCPHEVRLHRQAQLEGELPSTCFPIARMQPARHNLDDINAALLRTLRAEYGLDPPARRAYASHKHCVLLIQEVPTAVMPQHRPALLYQPASRAELVSETVTEATACRACISISAACTCLQLRGVWPTLDPTYPGRLQATTSKA